MQRGERIYPQGGPVTGDQSRKGRENSRSSFGNPRCGVAWFNALRWLQEWRVRSAAYALYGWMLRVVVRMDVKGSCTDVKRWYVDINGWYADVKGSSRMKTRTVVATMW
eukprot:5384534-Pyramimonas_sp.AAC.2